MLSQSKLRSALLEFFSEPDFQLSAQAADAWTDAYDRYGRDGQDASRERVTVVNRPGFRAALQFDSATGTAATMAQTFDRAFVAYWTGGVFAFGIPPSPAPPCPSVGAVPTWSVELSSLVTVVAPGVLAGLLTPIFSGVTKTTTPEEQAQRIAAAFHIATTSAVTVLISGLDTTPPPAGPLPLTNTCTVF